MHECCCRDFAAGVDVLTVEIEHVDVPALEAAARQLAMDIEPTPATLELIQVMSTNLAIHQACKTSGASRGKGPIELSPLCPGLKLFPLQSTHL